MVDNNKDKFWKTKEFEKLEKKWYDKLKKSGFEDAEKTVAGEKLLKKFAKSLTYFPQVNSIVVREGRAYYYQMAEQKANAATYSEDWHKTVMLKHAEGLNNVEISKELMKQKVSKTRQQVAAVIKKYMSDWQVVEFTNQNGTGATKEEKLLKFIDGKEYDMPERSLLEEEVSAISAQIQHTTWKSKKPTSDD